MAETTPTYRSYDVAGKSIRFATLGQLAWACGQRSKHTFLKMIKARVLPEANYRLPYEHGRRDGVKGAGTRLYSADVLLPKLVAVFAGIRQGVQITPDQKNALQAAFQSEMAEVAQL